MSLMMVGWLEIPRCIKIWSLHVDHFTHDCLLLRSSVLPALTPSKRSYPSSEFLHSRLQEQRSGDVVPPTSTILRGSSDESSSPYILHLLSEDPTSIPHTPRIANHRIHVTCTLLETEGSICMWLLSATRHDKGRSSVKQSSCGCKHAVCRNAPFGLSDDNNTQPTLLSSRDIWTILGIARKMPRCRISLAR
ncbi:hypothetical protein QCA50_011867 [Cerrena zonata]|uniref:Uncharacterized protein n=1 Tax=Cerrena zonata TaxID=2478898 RepID=A0AAW0G5T7_9APHY